MQRGRLAFSEAVQRLDWGVLVFGERASARAAATSVAARGLGGSPPWDARDSSRDTACAAHEPPPPRAPRDGVWDVDLDRVVMILPQVHLRKPCYDFTFL